MSINLGFSAAVVALSFVESLQKGASWEYQRDADPHTVDTDGDTTEYDYESDGQEAIHYGVSIGQGRGNAKIELTGDQFADVAAAFRDFDPEEDLSELSPQECIKRTIERHDDGTTTFKLSLARMSRTVKIPAGEWENFCKLMDANAGSVDRAVAHYRQISEAAEQSA